jgi:hypothetical protein
MHRQRSPEPGRDVDGLLREFPGTPGERIDEAVQALCREGGWGIADLEEAFGFSDKYHRHGRGNYSHSFPPNVRFRRLYGTPRASMAGPISFDVGLGFTEYDPPVEVSVYEAVGLESKPESELTSVCRFRHHPTGALEVALIQTPYVGLWQRDDVLRMLGGRVYGTVKRRAKYGFNDGFRKLGVDLGGEVSSVDRIDDGKFVFKAGGSNWDVKAEKNTVELLRDGDPVEFNREVFPALEHEGEAFEALHVCGIVKDTAYTAGGGDAKARVRALIEHKTPWAYADRHLLFAPAAHWFARRLGAKKVSFSNNSILTYPIYRRVYEYVRDGIERRGIEVTVK